jgi:hypothetical protein
VELTWLIPLGVFTGIPALGIVLMPPILGVAVGKLDADIPACMLVVPVGLVVVMPIPPPYMPVFVDPCRPTDVLPLVPVVVPLAPKRADPAVVVPVRGEYVPELADTLPEPDAL